MIFNYAFQEFIDHKPLNMKVVCMIALVLLFE